MKTVICDVCGNPVDQAGLASVFPTTSSLPFTTQDGQVMSVSYTFNFVVPNDRDICAADLRKVFLASIKAHDDGVDTAGPSMPVNAAAVTDTVATVTSSDTAETTNTDTVAPETVDATSTDITQSE